MKKTDFKIGVQIMWLLVILSTILVIIGTAAKIGHWGNFSLWLVAGFVSHLITWFLVLNDIIRNNVYNKIFWIISMVVFSTIAMIVYMIRRNKLLQ